MTDYYPPSSQTGPTPQAQDSPSMTDKASEAANQGKEAVGQVTQTAAEHAQEVKGEAVRQARDLAGEAREQLSSQVGQQHRSLVSNIRSLGSELGSMADSNSEQSGLATDLVGQARQRLDGVADWLDGRDPNQILDEVRNYARRRPGVFLLGALAAGVVAGRLTRGVVASHTADDTSSTTQPNLPASTESFATTPTTGYSTGGSYAQPGYGAQPDPSLGYGSTSTYGDGPDQPYGSPYGSEPYAEPQQPVQPSQDLPAGGAWR
jgi:hypothetical protein